MDIYKKMHVFQICTKFLNCDEIFELLFLNKYFYGHFKSLEVDYNLGFALARKILDSKSFTVEELPKIFFEFLGVQINSVTEILNISKYAKNLIKNPSGSKGFEGWSRKNGGNGWVVENFCTYNNQKTVFACSYQWGKLFTVIDLPKLGKKRVLIVGSPVSRRSDCGGTAKLRVYVINNAGEKKVKENLIVPQLDPIDKTPIWELLSISCEINDDDIQAKIIFSGKDENWWAGHYGPRFGYCFARIMTVD